MATMIVAEVCRSLRQHEHLLGFAVTPTLLAIFHRRFAVSRCQGTGG
jgi:hypothetical protein